MKKNLSVCLLSALILCLSGCSFFGSNWNGEIDNPTTGNNSWEVCDKFCLDDCCYNEGTYVEINHEEFEKLDIQNYVLFIYNYSCAFAISCEQIFEQFMEKYNIDFYSMNFAEFKQTKLHETVKFAPSVIIVKDWEIVAYLDTEKDEDLDKYQDEQAFEDWISQYIYLYKKD